LFCFHTQIQNASTIVALLHPPLLASLEGILEHLEGGTVGRAGFWAHKYIIFLMGFMSYDIQ
jgi:hypothetical protein